MYPTIVYQDVLIAPSQIQASASALADHLYEDGVREGGVVAVMLKNHPAYLEVLLACNLLGAYCCSINWHFKALEAGHILKDSGAQFLVVHAPFLDQLEGLETTARKLVLEQPGKQSLEADFPALTGYETYLAHRTAVARPAADPRGAMTYTSGSTGKPKGVRRLPLDPAVRKEMLERRDTVARAVFGIGPSSRCYVAAPLYHSAPFSYVTFAAAQSATLFLEPRFDEVRLLDLIETEKITHLYLVPTMYQRLLRLPKEMREKRDLSSVEFVASTGSPCSPALKQAMIEWWGPVFHEAYASTETGYITGIDSHEAQKKPGSAGRPLPFAQMRILGADDTPKKTGEIGLIYAVQTAYPDFTYANNDAARQAIDRAGLVTLGDMGYIDEDGYLFVCDRQNDMVISGGVNIYPAEIEAVINQLEGVIDCAVFGIPDAEFGEALAAAVQLAPAAHVTAGDLKDYLKARIANYKVPKRVDFHSELPREETGKIFKRRLRDPFWRDAGRSI